MAEHSSPAGIPVELEQEFREFWNRHSDGVRVAVGSAESHKLLGTREAFEAVLLRVRGEPIPIQVVPFGDVEQSDSLPMADEEAVWAARQECVELQERLGADFQFYVGNEGGLHGLDVAGDLRYFVRSWSVVRCELGEGWGGSSSVQLPLSAGSMIDASRRSLVIPGRRRSEGLVSALTHGLSDRRSAVERATANALGTLFFPR